MTSLGGLQLSDNLRLLGMRRVPIKASVQVAEGGVAHVLTAPLVAGRSLKLTGFYTSAQVEAIMAMCDGQARELVHPRGTFMVIIVGTDLADWIEYVDAGNNPDDFEEGYFELLEM